MAVFESKLEKTFYYVFLKPTKKWIFDQTNINLGEKTGNIGLRKYIEIGTTHLLKQALL